MEVDSSIGRCDFFQERNSSTHMMPSVMQLDVRRPEHTHTPRALSQSVFTLDDMSKQEESTSEETVTYLFPDFDLLHTIYSKDECNAVDITGFEIYIVEQWACDRKYSTVITAFTGDSEHRVRCGQVKLPKDRSKWTEKGRFLFKEIEDNGARLKETEKGYLFITNLSSVPSNLNLVPVPNGCVMDIWDCFKVNVNLKRMNCGGRSALFLCTPTDACEDKFRQVYKTHPKVDIMYSIRELVMLVQICLVDFKLLDPLFVDGLLCNRTEQKITEWWNLYGTVYYGIQPKDGLLGPVTVSAILGFVLSCHYRFDMASIDFPKEPFSYFSFRVIVGKFQKQYNLERTWYLDPITVDKLFKVTSKSSSSDISKLKKVVKSRVHDISGKTSSDRIATDVLTTDLEKALKYFNCSPRLEFLWYGKGAPMDLKQFEYYERMQASIMSASALKTGVGKIRNLPRRLQTDDYSLRRKIGDKTSEYKSSEGSTVSVDQLCQASKEQHPKVCKVVIADDEVCKRELKRRSSFPYLRQEINIPQLEYKNHSVDLSSKISESIMLKRSKSCSFINDTLCKWETTVSPIFVAHQLQKLEWHMLHLKREANEYLVEKAENKAKFERCNTKVNRVNQHGKPVMNRCEQQIQLDDRLHLKLSDIRATGARLEYELRLLGTRVRDAQDGVDNFEQKVVRFEKAMKNICLVKPESSDNGRTNGESGEAGSTEYVWYYRFNMKRVKYIWSMIEQFGPVQWVTGSGGSFVKKQE